MIIELGMRLLLIAYPFAGTGANMLRYRSLAYFLVKEGWEVDVIGYYVLKDVLQSGIHYYRIRKRLSFRLLLVFLLLSFQYIYLIKVQGFKEYLRRVGLASATYSLSISLLKQRHYETCLVGIHPWAFYLIVPLMRKQIRTVIDISDPLYRNAITKNSSHPSNLRLEQHALMAADYVITMNEPTIEIMTEEMGISRDKIEFITPSMNVKSYRYAERITYGLHKPLRMIYSGSLYTGYRDLSEVRPAIDQCEDVELDVYSNSSSLYQSSKRLHFYDWISHDDILRLYQEYDLLLFVDNAFGYQVPSKIFEMLAQNKPILFVYDKRNTYLYQLLKDQKGMYFVENKRNEISTLLSDLVKKDKIDVCYTFEMSDYSEEIINKKLLASMIK